MAILECVDLNRPWGRLRVDHLPNDNEFHALHVVVRGLDALLAGRDPGDEFTERILGHPEVQRRLLAWTPPAGKTV